MGIGPDSHSSAGLSVMVVGGPFGGGDDEVLEFGGGVPVVIHELNHSANTC